MVALAGESSRDHLRGSIPGVSYKPRPTDNQQRRSDARAKRLLGEQLARPRHDGADVPTVASGDAEPGTDDGRAGSGPEAKGARTEEEEGGEAAKGEEGGEETPEGQGEAGRKEEEGGEAAPPLEQLHPTPRERFSDGSSHLPEALPRHVFGARVDFILRRQEGVPWGSDVGRGVWAVRCCWLARRRKSRSATHRPRSRRCSPGPPRIGTRATWRASWATTRTTRSPAKIGRAHV